MNILKKLAEEVAVSIEQITAAVELLDQGATVPFIARYRKEKTQGMDDTQLRLLEERLHYLRELEERRTAILASIEQQEKLTPELKEAILKAETKIQLEDLYLPYKPKRRTKGQIAREAGIEPLAVLLLNEPTHHPAQEAEKYLNVEHKFTTAEEVLEGAKYILIELFSESAPLLSQLRSYLQEQAVLSSKLSTGKEKAGAKFKDYFDFSEKVINIPSHRALAILRGRKENILQIEVDVVRSDTTLPHPCEITIARIFSIENKNRPADAYLQTVVQWAWKVKLQPHLETELISTMKEKAEEEAIRVFARNLKNLLLSSPAGAKITLGLDPGLRTGVKAVVVDTTGKLLEYVTIFPHVPHNKREESLTILKHLCEKHKVSLVSIGNGTAGRETEALVHELSKNHPELALTTMIVNEAGASVYSASELAAKEFPGLDVSYRGSASIARRLQDPLAELVKIEPKSIGVGQYQHDVNQTRLARGLDGTVEDCVNAVGVDVNTASAALLARVSGLNQTIAKNIVQFRDEQGRFTSREQLKRVPRFGDKTFEQAAGFLRITDGLNPLDASSVHPESYPLVETIAQKHETALDQILGNKELLSKIKPEEFVTEEFGLPTLIDILKELEKPGRDPRPEFRTVKYKEGVFTLSDLTVGMVMEGIITNVTNFGAFVDIGVHQDGLVHISVISEKFIKDPNEVVKTGDIVKVKVVEVDIERKRISLSMRLNDQPAGKQEKNQGHARPASENKPRHNKQDSPKTAQTKPPMPPGKTGTFADLFANAKQLKPQK